MPAHDLVVIGFDSGEVQIYQGLDETGNASPEPGNLLLIFIKGRHY